MQVLGRARKAFVLNELPITSDGATMATEGAELEKLYMADLIENRNKIYLTLY